jgi:hypothetical protein
VHIIWTIVLEWSKERGANAITLFILALYVFLIASTGTLQKLKWIAEAKT